MRIVSLLPSATDILCVLGLEDRLVGRTHECDWPPGVESVPAMTSNALDLEGKSSREIDAAVGSAKHSGSSIYNLDVDALRQAQPDLILTQELCEVCAVSYREVASAARMIEGSPRVVSLEPRCIDDILENIRLIGELTGAEEAAEGVISDSRRRIGVLRETLSGREQVRTLSIEWLDPIYICGHWVPEQVSLGGGVELLGRKGEPSREIEWDEVVAAAPQVVVIMPCGVSIESAISELKALSDRPGWDTIPAVREQSIWAVDGPSYFNRPGPRVVRGAEIMAGILHPESMEVSPSEAVRIERNR